jgi:hypothetical protein
MDFLSLKGFLINGTERALGAVINMTVYATDFFMPANRVFYICIETAAPIEVMLADGSLFSITSVQAAAYLGRWYPAALIRVIKVGSTGNFSFGY